MRNQWYLIAWISQQQRCCYALYHEFAYLVIISLLLFISYAFLRYADIPVYVSHKDITYFEDSTTQLTSEPSANQSNEENTLEYEVSFPVYAMAFMSFFGYVMFVIFGGVGLSALPIDLIQEFRHRPK